MGREPDLIHLERRAQEERKKAENAADPVAYRLHTEVARAYERAVLSRIRAGASP